MATVIALIVLQLIDHALEAHAYAVDVVVAAAFSTHPRRTSGRAGHRHRLRMRAGRVNGACGEHGGGERCGCEGSFPVLDHVKLLCIDENDGYAVNGSIKKYGSAKQDRGRTSNPGLNLPGALRQANEPIAA